MQPVVFTVLGLPVHGYFFFLTVGFLVAMLLATHRTYSEELDVLDFVTMELAIVSAALVGSRAFFVWEAWDHFAVRPGEIWKLWRGGLAFYGGFTFGGAAGLGYILQAGMPLGRVTDLCAPYITLGHIFGKVGCLFHGCCYGKPTGAAWGLAFPATAHDLLPRHPAQIYEFAGLILLFVALHAVRARRPAPGTAIATYLLGYGGLRFLLEYVRDDMVGPAYLGLFRYQWISLMMAVGGLALLARIRPWVVR